jgi:tRNA G10  N-methylase Trm11
MHSIFILGRQPGIGRAELESLFGSQHLEPITAGAILSDIAPQDVNFSRLGSVVKHAEYLGVIPKATMASLHTPLDHMVMDRAKEIAEGKVQLGISAYGIKTSPKQLMAIGLNLKKSLRKAGFSVRLTPNQENELSSAQVLHNHLVGERGMELILVRHGADIVVGRTIAIQDINAYAKRDQGRPKRDAFVGMLPPKLAQTIINLAAADQEPALQTTILDPFCGTGVLLQEALLMGYGVYGSDLEPRMIDYSRQNLDWLHEKYDTAEPVNLEVGDATNHTWDPVPAIVACEAYLGHPLTSWPRPEKIQQIIGTCNVITEKFMRNIAGQIPAGTRLCLGVPAWKSPTGKIYHLPLLDHLEEIGYNRVSFRHSSEQELVYYRPDQIVARELLVITRK